MTTNATSAGGLAPFDVEIPQLLSAKDIRAKTKAAARLWMVCFKHTEIPKEIDFIAAKIMEASRLCEYSTDIGMHELNLKREDGPRLDRIQDVLTTMGYKVKLSCSSSWVNERLFISWKK